jgi:two-component system OmpR family sensor kinase
LNRLFLRFLAPILISIALASVLVYLAISLLFGDLVEQNAKNQASAQIFLLEQYIDSAPSDEWLTRLNKVREVSQVKFDLISLAQAKSYLNHAQQQQLMAGQLVIDAFDGTFYRRVDIVGDRYVGSNEDVIFAHNLPIDFWLTLKLELLRYFIIALVILIPVAFWSHAHWRDVKELVSTADAFGHGHFSQRAKLHPKSSIYSLSQQMNQMAQRIEQLIKAQKNLLHSVSHELRTPIARLTFGLELLHYFEGGQDAFQKRVEAMQTDIAELNELVSELLEMSSLEQAIGQKKLQLESVNTHAFFDLCAQQQQPSILERSLNISVDPRVLQMTVDVKLLRRAVGNVLKNAVKYSQQQIHIEVSLSTENRIQIVIEDDGEGISTDDAAKIFQAFFRVDDSRNKITGGYGLGLSIAQQAIKLHQGTIEVTASQLGGARFIILIPCLDLETV